MNQEALSAQLADLSLGWVQYLPKVGSTNDFAAHWIDAGAPDMSVVVANEQTAGRGRMGRRWFTRPDGALAFSVVLKCDLHGNDIDSNWLIRFTALGAVAVCSTLQREYHLPAKIKWPNDVLINKRKVAGILAEAKWKGEKLLAIILGIGINIASDSLPEAEELDYPAGALEEFSHQSIERLPLLKFILKDIIRWRAFLMDDSFIKTWERNLAFINEWVRVHQEDGDKGTVGYEGVILGLNADGSLRVGLRNGIVEDIYLGDVHIRV